MEISGRSYKAETDHKFEVDMVEPIKRSIFGVESFGLTFSGEDTFLQLIANKEELTSIRNSLNYILGDKG